MNEHGMSYLMTAFLVALTLLAAGCFDDQKNADGDQQNEVQIVQTNFVPLTLAAKSYTFAATANRNFPEPLNSNYTIDFNSDTSYTLHPTLQSSGRPVDRQGSYTYDARSGITHFVETAPDSGRTIDAA